MTWRIPLSDVDYGPEELAAVTAVLASKWLTLGEVTQRFERAFAERLGVRHAFAVSNATAALHLAYAALGLGPGDQVLVPSLTFVATANAILYTGARPVFADIVGEDDLCVDPVAIESLITPATRAIAVMHYAGYCCDMTAIQAVAQRHGLAIIEDAAHAPGASYAGRMAGTLGDVACFSFFGNKNLVTGEGGMVVTDRDDLAETLRIMRSHGMTSLTWDRHRGHAHSYDVVALGYNYRIDELHSALGLAQLAKLERNNARRRAVVDLYRAQLAGMAEVHLPFADHPGVSSAHIMPMLLDPGLDRGAFIASMKDQGIQTSIHYPPIHQFTFYRQQGFTATLPLTDAIAAREVTLPLYPQMTAEDVALVVDAIRLALPASRLP